MRPRFLVALVFALAIAAVTVLAPAERADAKGNDAWVLTGGELGDYAMRVTVDLVERPVGTQIAPPSTVPAIEYDFLGFSGNFAIPYQLAHGPWVRYYPDLGLLRLHGGSDPNDTWFVPSVAKRADLDQAVRDALAAKAAGQLERNPAAVDFRARSLEKVRYRLEPLAGQHISLNASYASAQADDGTMQISGASSEEFVMHALVDTVSRPPAGSSSDPPAYQISYAGYIRPGEGIGGLLGYYAPPVDGHGGRFWDDAFASDKSTPYYETTPEFDVIVSTALHREASEAAATNPPTSSDVGHGSAITAAVAFGLGLMLVLAALRLTSRRLRRA